MACSYPQWRIPWEPAFEIPGKYRHRLADQFEKRVHNGGIICQRPEAKMIEKEYPALFGYAQQIPCGKCIQCRLARSREWANRCVAELETSVNAFFVTLTYDDAHLEFSPYVDVKTGELSYRPILVKKHLQDFFKRLRSWCDYRSDLKQRYYACGEYGDLSLRPHYHAIIYNLPPAFVKDSRLFTGPEQQPPLWITPALTDLWPFGMSVYGDVSWNTCAYVARYVMEKQLGISARDQRAAQAELFPNDPWQEEFTIMSRRPGIGREYYERNRDVIYSTDEMFVFINGTVQAVKPARYFDKLFDVDNHLEMRRIKSMRAQVAQNSLEAALLETSLTEEEYLALKAESKEEQLKRLVRPSI